ncbi:MAG: class I SAM-dependent methyltransferase [Candidatus Taylorbacteria bacterium]|nr:class I SAM-dependent methyltransferase [Candidatus Taylorbacteria bacterium]
MIEMQSVSIPTPLMGKPKGTGGFLDPGSIVENFGVEEGMKIADFGCGAGYFTISLAEKTGPSGKVYALDILEHALDSVRGKARITGLDNIETIRTNLEIIGSSSLSDASQDMVLLANILFQSVKREAIFKEAGRVLKKGGRLILIDWKKGTGGFGPPDNLRLDSVEIQKTANKQGFEFEGQLEAGTFHFGLIFSRK